MMDNMKFNFTSHVKKFWIVSACILLVGLLINAVFGVEMDISFKGGTSLRYEYTGELDAASLEAFFTEQIGEAANVSLGAQDMQSEDGTVSSVSFIKVYSAAAVDSDRLNEINENIVKAYPDNDIKAPSDVKALSASLGNWFFVKCLVALLIAAAFLVLYVALRFRKIGGWPAGIMAVAALLHDLAMVYFAFVIFRIPLNDNFVAVMLTILGYSLNDTIVIYDRIRENRSRMGKDADMREVVNLSLHQSFRRTMNTSVSTLIVVVVLVVVALTQGVDAIISFAVPMLFGVLSGFYSSVFLCAPTWAHWMNKRNAKA